MRIKNVEFDNEDSLIIYINNEEKNNKDIINKIEEYKKTYKNVSVFISGNIDMKNTLKRIIYDKK